MLKALYSHKEKSCTHVICVGNYPYLSMFVQIGRGYHYQGKNKFHIDENMPGKYCFKSFAILYTLNSLLGTCSFPLHVCGVVVDSELADSTKREMNLILVSKICYIFQKIQMLDVWEPVANWNEK